MATATLNKVLADLNDKMMKRAEALWALADATEHEEEAEQWEACAMVAEECADLVEAAAKAAT